MILPHLIDILIGGNHSSVIVDRRHIETDMEFVQNFTLPDFQAKNFTPSISPKGRPQLKKNVFFRALPE